MHEKSLNDLVGQRFTKSFLSDQLSASNLLSNNNKNQIEECEVPENVKIPTGEDIRNMKTWEMKYKLSNPKASDRQVKRALQNQFNILVIKGQNYIPK